MAIYVLPTEQGRGAGTCLLQRAEAGLVKLGHTSSYLWVLAENQQARSFYQKNGWQDAGIKQRREILGQEVDLLQYRWAAK